MDGIDITYIRWLGRGSFTAGIESPYARILSHPIASPRIRALLWSNRPGVYRPEALTEPRVNLSTHTVLAIRLHEA